MAKSFLKKSLPSGEMELQITSMADIFTILLVFLLKSYSSSISQVTPEASIHLPIANSQEVLKDALKVEIAKSGVLVDEKKVASLSEFNPSSSDVDFSRAIYEKIMQERKKRGKTSNSSLLILADEKAPYRILQKVLSAVSKTGFVDLQLVVVSKEG